MPPKKEGGRPGSRFTGRTISLREIRILRPDKGQTAILTNIDEEIEAAQIAPILFDRIGSQENSFKYLRSAFGLDECWTYGKESVAEVADHPNPDFKALEKTLRRLREARAKILQEIGQALQDNPLHAIREQTAEANGQLEKKESEIAQIQATLSQTPARKKPIEENYVQPESAPRSLVNTMRLVAWEVETLLVGLLSADYSRSDDEGRSLIAAAMHTSGSLRLAPGELIIQLAPQASPNRTRAINAVGTHLNALRVKYPGSGRVLRFEPTPVAPPPIQRNRNTA